MTPTAPSQVAELKAAPVFYSPAYVGAARAFDTTRKAAWVAASLRAHTIAGLSLVEPAALAAGDIAAIHNPAYVDAVRTGWPRELATSSGLGWDAGVWDAVCASNGGAVAAALHAWRSRAHAGSLSSGLHHASWSQGAALCTFNGLALAVHAVLADGAQRVLILDLDAHCAGGTYSMVRQWGGVVQLDIAVSAVDHYAVDPAGQSTLDLVTDADRYLPTLEERLAALGGCVFDVVVYNAGVDPYEGCPIGGFEGITRAVLAERERIVFEWARAHGVPVAFVLAGGYVGRRLLHDALVGLHRLTVAAMVLGSSEATLTATRIRTLADTPPI